MTSRFLLSPIAVLCLVAALPAALAEPGPAVVVAQLGPTSPGFRMGLKRGETGAPEATAVGATPIERRAGAASSAEWRSAASHSSAKTDEPEHKAPAFEARPDGRADEHARSEARSADQRGARAEPAKTAASGSPMDQLREKLAARLGAKPSPNGRFAMQVSNRGESGENVISSVRPSAAAVSGARRKHAAASAVAGDVNMDIAANAGQSLLPTHWDYEGEQGPEAWGRLRPEFSKCASGQRQSPIDIRGGIAVDLEPIRFDYRSSAFSVIDNGHTVQVNVEPGNAITITGKRYELVQFHFHRPSEERVNGRQYDMVVHLVHKDADGKLAVVAVLLDRGGAQPVVQSVWNNLPLEKGDEVRAGTRIDLAQLLPEDRRYYTYMGSLTTPPCSEGVLWMVMKQPVPVSVEQVAIFSRLYPMNARPIQQADGRLIKESN
jgi:carbonic anhydrase